MQGPLKEVELKGFYQQGQERHAMDFMNVKMDFFGHFACTGSDTVGEFSLEGKFQDKENIEISKQYKGAHKVTYKGKIDKDYLIKGTWQVESLSGPFEIQLICEHWHGYFIQDE